MFETLLLAALQVRKCVIHHAIYKYNHSIKTQASTSFLKCRRFQDALHVCGPIHQLSWNDG